MYALKITWQTWEHIKSPSLQFSESGVVAHLYNFNTLENQAGQVGVEDWCLRTELEPCVDCWRLSQQKWIGEEKKEALKKHKTLERCYEVWKVAGRSWHRHTFTWHFRRVWPQRLWSHHERVSIKGSNHTRDNVMGHGVIEQYGN